LLKISFHCASVLPRTRDTKPPTSSLGAPVRRACPPGADWRGG
jgi:hypothetical protein